MNKAASSEGEPRIEITPPRLLGPGAVLAVSAYGLVLVVPVFISMLAVSVMRLGWPTFAIPAATLAAVTFFLPLGFGNPHVAKLVRALGPAPGAEPGGWAVQLTCTPRLRAGLRALLDDADDVGLLCFEPTALVFRGDSVQLRVPLESIQEVRRRNIGWRGLFVYGHRTVVVAPGLQNITRLEFSERCSWSLPGSRKASRQLYERLRQAALAQPVDGET
jgi:hypothetical protein